MAETKVTRNEMAYGTFEEVGRSSTLVSGVGGTNQLLVTLSKPCKYVKIIAAVVVSQQNIYTWLRFNEISDSNYNRAYTNINTNSTQSVSSSTGSVAVVGDIDYGFNLDASASASGVRISWSSIAGSHLRLHTGGGRLTTNASSITSVRLAMDNATVTSAELIVLGYN